MPHSFFKSTSTDQSPTDPQLISTSFFRGSSGKQETPSHSHSLKSVKEVEELGCGWEVVNSMRSPVRLRAMFYHLAAFSNLPLPAAKEKAEAQKG